MIIKTLDVFCDCCDDWTHGVVTGTPAQARKNAAHAGWVRIDGKDYCPHCAKRHRY